MSAPFVDIQIDCTSKPHPSSLQHLSPNTRSKILPFTLIHQKLGGEAAELSFSLHLFVVKSQNQCLHNVWLGISFLPSFLIYMPLLRCAITVMGVFASLVLVCICILRICLKLTQR